MPAAVVPEKQSLAPVVKLLRPAVVNIATSTLVKNPHRRRTPRNPGDEDLDDMFERYFGAPKGGGDMRRNSLGSGFIINSAGYVLTNNHVVEGATDIKVRLTDDREVPARIVGRDPKTDVALIRLENVKDLPTVPLGDSDAVEQGDFVLAMGNPFGLRESVSFGIVSAKDRNINNGNPFDDFIQTDAAINPGNSGGPLFNLKGEVIGINSAIVSPSIGQGIGFAVPINLVKSILPQLEKGKVSRGWLGVGIAELTPDLAQGFRLPPTQKGVVIQQVYKGPARKAGLKPGDIVVGLNGKPTESSLELTRGVAEKAPGTAISLTVLRNGVKRDVPLSVGTRPENEEAAIRSGVDEEPPEEEPVAHEGPSVEDRLGLKVAELTRELAREIKVEGDTGVVVRELRPDGPAARAGVQADDLILEVNRQPVARPSQYQAALGKLKAGEMALLRIRRAAAAMYIAVKVPAAAEKR